MCLGAGFLFVWLAAYPVRCLEPCWVGHGAFSEAVRGCDVEYALRERERESQ